MPDLQAYVTLTKDLVTIAGIMAGAIWFYYRWEHGRRAQLDLDCIFFHIAEGDDVVAEIRLTLENKGVVEQQVYGFQISVHAPSEPIDPPTEPPGQFSPVRQGARSRDGGWRA